MFFILNLKVQILNPYSVYESSKAPKRKRKKKETKSQSCFGIQCNKKPEKINFINKPTFTSLTSNKKSRHKKKKQKKSQIKQMELLAEWMICDEVKKAEWMICDEVKKAEWRLIHE